MPCLVCVAPLGQIEQRHFGSRVHVPTGIAFQRVGAAPLEPIPPPRFDPMPQRGIAYQPRVPTLGLHPEKQTRVLKERRIAGSLGHRPRLSYAVFLQNTPILSEAVPRVGTLGWYALPRWGKWNDHVSDHASVPPTGTSRSIRLVRPLWGKWDDGVSDPAFDWCGQGAKSGNRGQRARLQRRRRRLRRRFGSGSLIAVGR